MVRNPFPDVFMQSLLPDSRRSSQDRFTFLMMLIFGVLLIQMWSSSDQAAKRRAEAERQQLLNQQVLEKKDAPVPAELKPAEPSKDAVAATTAEPAWITLGSMDPKSPYRMLVTLTNQGAAVSRIELNDPTFRDVEAYFGYLGQIVADADAAEASKDGVMVQIVGKGTPAEQGLKVGDKITQIDRKLRESGKEESFETKQVRSLDDIRQSLAKTKPGDQVDFTIVRPGLDKPVTQSVILGRHPMNVIRPESVPRSYEEYTQLAGLHGFQLGGDRSSDQLSFLTTLQRVDDNRLDLPRSLGVSNSSLQGIIPRDKTLDIELSDVNLRKEPWEIVSTSETEAVFRKTIPTWNLEFTKTYRLVSKEDQPTARVGDGYELTLQLEVRNLDTKEHTIAYQLDGPTGLPLEGGWYAQKSGPGWGGYGIRDLVVQFTDSPAKTIANSQISTDQIKDPWVGAPLDYMGIDSRYFQCTLKPKGADPKEVWLSTAFPIRVGERNSAWPTLTDVSFRIIGKEQKLAAGNGPDSRLNQEFTLFVGPKRPAILAEYGLGETIAYGWFWFVAKPMLVVLHFFHGLGLNYAMAIIALTICVRLCMFPLSRKQALGAIKMQAIQPELKAVADKYADDPQARMKAQNEVFKKHNYHPASGCLPIFIQLPIFIGLYKSLSIDVELYGASLISEGVRWCNDLSAPDMLIDWHKFWTSIGWPGFNTGHGMFCLGPYFNLLPMLTIALFLIQQAVMMPPPTDEQSRMQRTMMQYMMIFMGFLFFKVPSGLCVYFIASTLWGLAERRFIPKPVPNVGNEMFDVTPTHTPAPPKEKDRDRKSGKRHGHESEPPKQEGFFSKLFREVSEKAAERQQLGKTDKKDKDRDRKKKR